MDAARAAAAQAISQGVLAREQGLLAAARAYAGVLGAGAPQEGGSSGGGVQREVAVTGLAA